MGHIARDQSGRHHAAVSIHHQDVAVMTACAQFLGQPRQIPVQKRLDTSVDRGGNPALALTRFLQNAVPKRDMNIIGPDV